MSAWITRSSELRDAQLRTRLTSLLPPGAAAGRAA